MHGVAKQVEDRGQLVRDIVRDFEGVKRRDHQIFGKRTCHSCAFFSGNAVVTFDNENLWRAIKAQHSPAIGQLFHLR